MSNEEIEVAIEGLHYKLSDLEMDVKAAQIRFGNHGYAFTPSTVQGLIDKVKDLSAGPQEKLMYFYKGGTGCTCCSRENFHRGPYATAEEVLRSVKNSHDSREVCSQYSSNGRYTIYCIPTYDLGKLGYLAADRIFEYEAASIEGDDFGIYGGNYIEYRPEITEEVIEAFYAIKQGVFLRDRKSGEVVVVMKVNSLGFEYRLQAEIEVIGTCRRIDVLKEFEFINES